MTGFPDLADGYSSAVRPVLRGVAGAVSAAHPLAVAGAQAMLFAGGSAVDAAIAAQAVLCVVAPDACGLGGDMLALVDERGTTLAVNGAGLTPRGLVTAAIDGANSVTVPGLVDGWCVLHERWGRLPLSHVLATAIGLAAGGIRLSADLAGAAMRQRARLLRGGAGAWPLLGLAAGDRFVQPELADALRAIGRDGRDAFYAGPAAAAIAAAVQAGGGALVPLDLAEHATPLLPPIAVRYAGVEVAVQPPATQGVLLAMALQALERTDPGNAAALADHLAIELTEAAFVHRDRVGEGAALLAVPLAADREQASRRGGPRAYLHTAGVATADANGLVVSSLVSVFDDFGSCLFVPELGITLNNRGGGFTGGANAAGPAKRPVHTLAPALVRSVRGSVALATPGADGQVQTLLQVIDRSVRRGEDLAAAIAAPRWRSEGGALLIEEGHAAAAALAARGHRVTPIRAGEVRFGAIACAGIDEGEPFAVSDWRRQSWAGVA